MPRIIYPALQAPVLTPAQQPEQVTESRWHQPWSEPVRQKINPVLAIALMASGLFAPVLTDKQIDDTSEARWHQPWSEPVRQKIDPRLAVALATSGPISEYSPAYVPANDAVNHLQPWSEPVRFKIDPKEAIALAASGPFAPVLTQDQITATFESRWHYPWSTPVRLRIDPRLAVALASSGPFAPVLTQDQLIDSLESRWHQPWSEPVRWTINPRLAVALDTSGPRDAIYALSFTVSKSIPWFKPFDIPVWPRKGLNTHLQQFDLYETVPKSYIIVTLAATETNTDSFLGGVFVSGSTPSTGSNSANVSLTEIPANDSGAVSIEEET